MEKTTTLKLEVDARKVFDAEYMAEKIQKAHKHPKIQAVVTAKHISVIHHLPGGENIEYQKVVSLFSNILSALPDETVIEMITHFMSLDIAAMAKNKENYGLPASVQIYVLSALTEENDAEKFVDKKSPIRQYIQKLFNVKNEMELLKVVEDGMEKFGRKKMEFIATCMLPIITDIINTEDIDDLTRYKVSYCSVKRKTYEREIKNFLNVFHKKIKESSREEDFFIEGDKKSFVSRVAVMQQIENVSDFDAYRDLINILAFVKEKEKDMEKFSDLFDVFLFFLIPEHEHTNKILKNLAIAENFETLIKDIFITGQITDRKDLSYDMAINYWPIDMKRAFLTGSVFAFGEDLFKEANAAIKESKLFWKELPAIKKRALESSKYMEDFYAKVLGAMAFTYQTECFFDYMFLQLVNEQTWEKTFKEKIAKNRHKTTNFYSEK